MPPLAAAILLVLGLAYLWLDDVVRRREVDPAPAPRPTYVCRQCGRRVDMAATVRPIRLTLLCPEDYRAQYGGLRPAPGPRPRRPGRPRPSRPPIVPIPPRR